MEPVQVNPAEPLSRPGAAATRRRAWRRINDRVTAQLMAIGGIGVIVAIVLIFFYLLYVVLPLFQGAEAEARASYPVPGGPDAPTLHLALDEYGEIGLRVDATPQATFFRARDGETVARLALPAIGSARVSAAGAGDPDRGVIALGLDDGRALVLQHRYAISFPDDERLITPQLAWPLGPEPLLIDERAAPLVALDVQASEDRVLLVAVTADGRTLIRDFRRTESLLDGSVSIEQRLGTIADAGSGVTQLALSKDMRSVFLAAEDGRIGFYDLADVRAPRLIDWIPVVEPGVRVTALDFVTGGVSLLIGDSTGRVTQWFPVRDADNRVRLERVRAFREQSAPITALAPEHRRKGFVAAAADGSAGIYHTTAHRTLALEAVAEVALSAVAISARADAALFLDRGHRVQLWALHNEHPEVSWQVLWGKVWYENRTEPEYIWQSSAASSDFEPKFSLTPLAFGTVKAAFYAMLFAVPLAIAGAIYAGYFMSPRMRGAVKPTIEVMAAIPTVILGFLAGLWLAPIIEHNLAGFFLALPAVPLAVLLTGFTWSRMPEHLRYRFEDGWEGLLLVPVICLAVAGAFMIGAPIEAWFFGGDLPHWLSRELGIDYDQRNSLVVGIMMGFAVIPTIFSISEDAVFGVPRHLTVGSLALGATPWQTMVRVVLLTASPGMFSGVMIGLGRAVGETMIVLMATGNTPIMDMNIFQGFRALSANIAVEMPESEVGSTHYRILFLAALVLFLVTFVVNTAAELVRQRLRVKYASL